MRVQAFKYVCKHAMRIYWKSSFGKLPISRREYVIDLSGLSASYPDGKEDQDAEALADGDVDFVDNIADNKSKITKVRNLSPEFEI